MKQQVNEAITSVVNSLFIDLKIMTTLKITFICQYRNGHNYIVHSLNKINSCDSWWYVKDLKKKEEQSACTRNWMLFRSNFEFTVHIKSKLCGWESTAFHLGAINMQLSV